MVWNTAVVITPTTLKSHCDPIHLQRAKLWEYVRAVSCSLSQVTLQIQFCDGVNLEDCKNQSTHNGLCLKFLKNLWLQIECVWKGIHWRSENQTWINQKEKSLLPLPILIICNEKSEWSHYCCSKHFLHNNIDCNLSKIDYPC